MAYRNTPSSAVATPAVGALPRSQHPFAPDGDEPPSSSDEEEDDDEDDGTAQILGPSPAPGDGGEADDPDADRTTAAQTFLHILKGNVGPGCLSLPWATSVLGVPLSLATLAALCVVTSYNCWAMVRWKRRHASDRRDVSYADLGELAYGPRFRNYVLCCVCATQLCVCTVFFSFIGENVAAVMRAWGVPMLDDPRAVMSAVLPVAAALSCAPNLRVLAPATACGMVLLSLAFGCIGAVIGRNWTGRDVGGLPTAMGDWNEVPLAMCAFLYSFEAINLVLPIEAAMMDPTKFDCVFFLGMFTVSSIYAVFACVCVAAFGVIDDGSVTAFLMEHSEEFAARRLVLVANFVVSISVLVTYPLQLFPAINLISQLRGRSDNSPHRPSSPVPQCITGDAAVDGGDGNMDISVYSSTRDESLADFLPLDVEQEKLENELGEEGSHFERRGGLFQNRRTFRGDSPFLRAALVLGTYLLAILIPNVQELISLSGAIAGSSCALIVPPALELRSILESRHRFSPAAVLRYILLMIGVVFLIVGTAASVRDIVKAFQNG